VNSEIPFLVHVIEGAQGMTNPTHVAELKKRGVAYAVLAHLRYMGIATVAQGLPCKTDFWQKLINGSLNPDVGITDLGYQFIDAMWGAGMVLDVTHCADKAKAQIIEYHKNSAAKPPVISSHTGVRGTVDYPLNLSDKQIKFIAKSGGVVGIIVAKFWLMGTGNATGFDWLCKAITHVRNLGGDDAVCIGTDLDGFIQPISGVANFSAMNSLAKKLAKNFDGESEFVEKLLWKNAYRILHFGLN
jgi:microsomal dipeptidase-like Zn-dependent dipeptidase